MRRRSDKESKSSEQQSNAVETNLATNFKLGGRKERSEQDQEEPCFFLQGANRLIHR
jgi:hypothetical protein